jgi:hypothetical protein
VLWLLLDEPVMQPVHRCARARLPQREMFRRTDDLARLGLVLDTIHVESQLEPVSRSFGLGDRRQQPLP